MSCVPRPQPFAQRELERATSEEELDPESAVTRATRKG